MPKPARPPARRQPSSRSTGLERIQVSLEPRQVTALQHEAKRRRGRPGQRRSDVSEVLREAVSIWMAIRPPQRALIQGVAARRELTRPEVLREAIDAWLTALDPGTL